MAWQQHTSMTSRGAESITAQKQPKKRCRHGRGPAQCGSSSSIPQQQHLHITGAATRAHSEAASFPLQSGRSTSTLYQHSTFALYLYLFSILWSHILLSYLIAHSYIALFHLISYCATVHPVLSCISILFHLFL